MDCRLLLAPPRPGMNRRHHHPLFALALTCFLLLPAASLWADEPPNAEAAKEDKPAPAPKAEPAKPANPPAPQPRLPQGPLRFNIQVQGGRAVVLPRAVAGAGTGDLEDIVNFARDRDAEQLLKKAAGFLEEKRFSESARALGAIIEAPEDFFFQPEGDQAPFRSLKAEAERLLGSMPSEGRQAYDLQFGPRAAELLRQALRDRDWNKLTDVSRRFFHTDAGYQATYLLGQYHLDHQRPLAAGLCFERLKSAGPPARKLEPALSLQLAAAWLKAGMPDRSREVLVALKDQFGAEQVVIEGQPVPWFARESQAVSWLEQQVGSPHRGPDAQRDAWAMLRGDPARNASATGGIPLLDSEGDCWSIPNYEDAGVEKLVENLSQTYRDANFSALPVFQPLAVGDVVLMRTISTLLAVDFQTGKRLWNVPVDENWGEVTDLRGAIAQQGNASQIVSLLDQRLWDDATYGSLSSDGRFVFSVEDLNLNLPTANQQPRMVVLPNGRRLPAPAWPRNFNRLAAHDIKSGKLKWELGGPRGEYELPLAGAFFLGPPLPLLDVVYAIAEINGEIRVVAIDAKTGEVQWGQQLVVVELDVLQDASRRFSGVSPSYSDGVLICPTGSSAVVALDLTTRSLLWGYRYANTSSTQPTLIGRRIGAMIMFSGRPREEADRWMDSSAIIAGGRVLVTPIESNEIHCLNLLDGQVLWKKPRGDNLYVGGVHDQKVIVVGRSGVMALRLEDGEPAWSAPVEYPSGGAPSGRGFLADGRYYLPLASAEVIAIDLDQGALVERSRSRKPYVPGNLVCHRGMILSQNVESLNTFYELDTLKRQVAAAIDANPQDPDALAQRGALALHHGDVHAAIADLRKSFDLAPRPRTRDLLIDALFEGLNSDFADYSELGGKLEQLISTPDERSRFIRIMAEGLRAQGKHRAAFDLYLQLTGDPAGALTVDRLSDARRVRRDRWTQAGLASFYQALSADERAQIDALIARRADQAAQAAGPEALKQFIDFFGFHPAGDLARDRLAQRLAAAGDWLGAELLWRQVVRSSDQNLSRQAVVRLALAMKEAGRPDLARHYATPLESDLASVVCLDGKTGRQWAAEILADPIPDAPSQIWPVGRILKERDERQRPTSRYFPAELSPPGEIYPGLMTVEMSQDRQTIVGRDGNGVERWKASLGDPGFRQNVNPSVLQARSAGNLVVVSLGGRIMGIDTLTASGAAVARVLWTEDAGESVPGLTNQVGVHVRQIELPWGQHRNLVSDGFGRPAGALGQLTDNYCCLQRGRELVAIDPRSGDTLWMRGDVEPASEIFGDDQFVFVVPPAASEALVLSAVDGRELGKRSVTPFNQRVVTLGRRLVSWQSEAGRSVFRMTDAWEQKHLWRHEFASGAKAYQADGELLGVVEPEGRFVAIRLFDGKIVIDAPIEAEKSLLEIYLLPSRERLLLFTNRPWTSNQEGVSVQAVPGMLNNPLLTGMVYGFDRGSGQLLWRAALDKQGLTLDQPRDLPVLVLASRIYERQGVQGGVNTEPYTSVLCLDKRTGAIAYQEKFKGHIGIFELVALPEERIVELKLVRHTVRMKFTDQPLEPEAAPPGDAPAGDAHENAQPTPAPQPGDQGRLRPRCAPITLESRVLREQPWNFEESLG